MKADVRSIRLTDWLASRAPSAPPALARRLHDLLGDAEVSNPAHLPDVLIDRAAHVLARIGDDRTAATDLLAADALITYAMEAAAEFCLDVASIASQAVEKLASVHRLNPESGEQ
ncbi:MAG TPA: hypothetical protein VHM24_05740 [Gemmatimonadaceae bacterium]|nr:hypothetical protein [Gemmatimonadaceae bacterium]